MTMDTDESTKICITFYESMIDALEEYKKKYRCATTPDAVRQIIGLHLAKEEEQ